MENIEKTYENEDVKVVWKPSLCSHSANCWRGLSEVFNPKLKPWVDLSKAQTEKIIQQINECPSSALSYALKSKMETNLEPENNLETKVEVKPNGPLIVLGNLSIKDVEGNVTSKSNMTAFCRCGASSNKPFCDGSHRKIDFKESQ